MSLAKILLSGTVLSAPEKRYTPNGNAVVTFDMAVSNPPRGSFGPDAPFTVKVTCWNRLADAAAESLAPQQGVLVEGKLQMGSVQAPDGVTKKHFEIEASSLSLVHGTIEPLAPAAAESAPGASRQAPRPAPANAARVPAASAVSAAAPAPAAAPAFAMEDAFSEDDIPF